MHNMIGCVH